VIRAIVMGLLLFGVWLLWSGHYTPILLSLGVCSCLLTLVLSIRMNIVDDEGQPIHIFTRLPGYGLWLLKEIVLSNIDVSKRILHPSLPISPRIFVMKVGQQTELGQVIYANSITLTPGTITIRLGDNHVLVHALAGKAEEELRVGIMDRKVSKLEKSSS